MSLPRLAPILASAAADFRIACVLFALVSIGAASFTAAQSQATQGGATQESIRPIPAMPTQDSRGIALSEHLFCDPRLSHDDARSSLSCHDTRTNGASANAHERLAWVRAAFQGQSSFGAERL
jgi:cytochrome c peroxidase